MSGAGVTETSLGNRSRADPTTGRNDALHGPRRARDARRLPFAETKEQLPSLYILDCATADAAIAAARDLRRARSSRRTVSARTGILKLASPLAGLKQSHDRAQ